MKTCATVLFELGGSPRVIGDMGVIRIQNMQFYSHHGATEEEQALGQKFEVDVEFEYDFEPARDTDELNSAVNYVEIYALTRKVVENDRYHLIEALACAIRDRVLERFPGIEEIVVRVRKPSAPIGGIVDYVEAEIHGCRERES